MTLFIVATPIGNLADITLRALETLKSVDLIACEDTRQTKKLLTHYQISTPLLSFHARSGDFKIRKIIDLLQNGKKIALVSDAGTPGISDPGFRLTASARENKITIVPIPGPSAFLTALSASGVPIDKFIYLGYLPIKKGRQTIFQKLAEEKRTVVFYESVHRILRTLGELKELLGAERRVIIARELTKIYEEFLDLSLEEAEKHFQEKPPKGEFVVVLPAV